MRSYHLLFYKNIGFAFKKKKTYICANSHLERKDAILWLWEKEGEREKMYKGEGEGEARFNSKFRGFFLMLTPNFLCSLHDSNPHCYWPVWSTLNKEQWTRLHSLVRQRSIQYSNWQSFQYSEYSTIHKHENWTWKLYENSLEILWGRDTSYAQEL